MSKERRDTNPKQHWFSSLVVFMMVQVIFDSFLACQRWISMLKIVCFWAVAF